MLLFVVRALMATGCRKLRQRVPDLQGRIVSQVSSGMPSADPRPCPAKPNDRRFPAADRLAMTLLNVLLPLAGNVVGTWRAFQSEGAIIWKPPISAREWGIGRKRATR